MDCSTFINDPLVIGKWKSFGTLSPEEPFSLEKVDTSRKTTYEGTDEIYFLPHGDKYWIFEGWTKGSLFVHLGGDEPVLTYQYSIEPAETALYLLFPKMGPNGSTAVFQKIDDKEYTWESLGRRDKIDYPFVSDNHVLGRWVSVKFVERKEDFAPGHHETDLWLKSLEFLPDGSVNQQYGDDIWRNRWTKGLLLNQSMSTAAKYEIRHIKGKDYLFLEWKMGNYVFGGQPPEYYVFTREL